MDQTQLANLALTMMGQKQIGIITEDKPTAIRCNNLWEPSWEAFLQSHDWKFARKLQALALDASEPPIDFEYSYTLPGDCLMPRALVDYNNPFTLRAGNTPKTFDIVGGKLWTDVENAYLLYTANITDHNLMPPTIAMAFANYFAIQLCIGMTGSKAVSKLRDQLREDTPLFMAEAIRINDISGYNPTVESEMPQMNPYLAARS